MLYIEISAIPKYSVTQAVLKLSSALHFNQMKYPLLLWHEQWKIAEYQSTCHYCHHKISYQLEIPQLELQQENILPVIQYQWHSVFPEIKKVRYKYIDFCIPRQCGT